MRALIHFRYEVSLMIVLFCLTSSGAAMYSYIGGSLAYVFAILTALQCAALILFIRFWAAALINLHKRLEKLEKKE